MTRRRVFTRARSPRPFQPAPRDLRAVEDVGRFWFLTSAQLLELNWPRPSQRRHGESRLRELFHAGWLDRHPLVDGMGRPRAVYSLGHLGRLYTADKLGVAASLFGPRPAKERDRDLIFLKHHLMTVQTIINLKRAAERLGGSLIHYESERALRAKRGGARGGMPVVPDAFIVLVIGPRIQSFCIELDRATVGLRSWRQRLHRYWQWERTASFREG